MSIRVGRLLGIPIKIDASWLIIFALLVYTLALGYFPRYHLSPAMNWLGGIIASLLLFVSVLLHELMHSYVAKKNGLPVGGITLFIFGGVSELTEEPQSPDVELRMAIAGPATSLILGAVLLALGGLGGRELFGALGFGIVVYLGSINILLGLFNLIPGFPLDGGRVLRAFIWGSTNNLDRATRVASRVGQGIAYLFIFGGFFMMLFGQLLSGLWFVFIGWFLNNAAQQSYQQLILRRALVGVSVDRVMTTDFPHVDPDTSIYDFVHDYLLKYDYSAFPVTENDQLVGIVTVGEIRDIPRDEWTQMTVREIAKPPEEERLIDENDDAFNALMHMAQGNLTRLLVMHDGRLKGMVTQESLIRLAQVKLQIGDTQM